MDLEHERVAKPRTDAEHKHAGAGHAAQSQCLNGDNEHGEARVPGRWLGGVKAQHRSLLQEALQIVSSMIAGTQVRSEPGHENLQIDYSPTPRTAHCLDRSIIHSRHRKQTPLFSEMHF